MIRVHLGSEDQLPDLFIEAKEGTGQTPAYRGVAYVVFEDLALETFGNRLPQLSFEVIRPSPDPAAMERLVRAVNLIPSAGEFVYATETVTRTAAAPGLWNSGSGNGTAGPENENSVEGLPNLVASLNRLDAALPEREAVSLVVSWFGTDLRAGSCQVKPGVESATKTTTPMIWRVNGVTRTAAHVVSTVDGGPAYPSVC